MKTINKVFKVALLSVSVFALLVSCETIELDLTENPNAISDTQFAPDLLMNQIQLDFAFNIERENLRTAQLVRIDQFAGRDYLNSLPPTSLNATWTNSYQGMFSDIAALLPLAQEQELFNHIGVAKTLQAYMLVTLVDLIGDVPFSEATNPDEFPFPSVDPGASVYEVALDLLAQSDVEFAKDSNVALQNDFFYDNDFSNWSKLNNTLRMKMYATTRLVDAGAIGAFDAIVASGNFIDETAEDFQFSFGQNFQQPNTRHPRFNTDYTPTGAGSYRSNWLMNLMNESNDPRTRYYFFRQTGCTPGASCDPDGNEETLVCSLQDAPAHYAGFTFCSLEDGFWGRDHGNNEGIPPDGFLRTAIGVYPAGGKFDGNNFADDDDTNDSVGQEEGGRGGGIAPFLLASYVDFMRAEIALVNGNSGTAGDFLEAGLLKSINKVRTFGELDPLADAAFFATGAEATAFAADAKADFNAAMGDDQWNVLAEQYFVTQYGSGLDAFNFYRRTGYPTTLQPNLEPDPGKFPKSFFYPAVETTANPNIGQKDNLDVQVFWDNNPGAPGFPASN